MFVVASAAMMGADLAGHTLTRDGDLVRVVFRGPLTLADAEGLRVRVNEALAGGGHCYLLIDMRALTEMQADARRAIGEWGRTADRHISGAAIYGASFALRVLTTLMLNAVRVLARQDLVVHFARDEAASLAWLAWRRQQLARDEAARGG